MKLDWIGPISETNNLGYYRKNQGIEGPTTRG